MRCRCRKESAVAVSSSFPTARLPVLPLSKEKGCSDSISDESVGQHDSPTDEALIERIRNGDDDEALRILFRRYARLVWCIAQRILRDRGEAEDVMQEVFLMIYQKAALFDPSKGPPRTLIVYMTYQSAYKRRRYLNGRHSHYSCQLNENVATSLAVTAPFYDESIEAHFGKEGLRNALDAARDLALIFLRRIRTRRDRPETQRVVRERETSLFSRARKDEEEHACLRGLLCGRRKEANRKAGNRRVTKRAPA
jgi:RNA polymerase sigma factor (sigma-70 family)